MANEHLDAIHPELKLLTSTVTVAMSCHAMPWLLEICQALPALCRQNEQARASCCDSPSFRQQRRRLQRHRHQQQKRQRQHHLQGPVQFICYILLPAVLAYCCTPALNCMQKALKTYRKGLIFPRQVPCSVHGRHDNPRHKPGSRQDRQQARQSGRPCTLFGCSDPVLLLSDVQITCKLDTAND